MKQAGFEKHLADSGYASDGVQVLHHIAAARFKVCQHRSPAVDRLDVIERERHIHGPRHCDQMEHRVGRSSQDGNDDDGIFEGFPGHDVARLQIQLSRLRIAAPARTHSSALPGPRRV